MQVGPTWINGQSTTEQMAKFTIYLTAPANTTFTAPYTLSVTGRAPFSSVSAWNWNANVDSAGVVSHWNRLHNHKWSHQPCSMPVPAAATLLMGDAGAQATGVVPSNWQNLLPPSLGFVEVGGIFTGPIGMVFPQGVTINGIFCGLVGSVYYGS